MRSGARALILDFGGVITRTLFETHDLTESALGLPSGTLGWRGPFAPETDVLWQRMENGQITERDYWSSRAREVGHLLGEEWHRMSDLVIRARGENPQAVIRPETLELIAKTKEAGKKLAVLSNELDLFYGADFRDKLGFLRDFDVIADATHTGILKPDTRAYRDCLTELGEPAERCVFVDDQRRSVLGADSVGLLTVHFDVSDPQRSCDRAAELLGLHSQRRGLTL
jgi:putative hydrolase of the HAD superfamily